MKKRNITACLLAMLLVTNLLAVPAAAASEDTQATFMTMEGMEGTVTIRNAKNKEVTIRKGARLYKGYGATTEEGYLWIGLDDAKAIKLDWDTEITLKKSGKKLEILLESGKLFFNVSKPLESDESLTIRTSNMSTSIRGTSGIFETETFDVEMNDAQGHALEETVTVTRTTVTMLDGQLAATSAKPEDPEQLESYPIAAGWQGEVTSTAMPADDAGEQDVEISLTPIAVADALQGDPFAAVEAANDAELMARIEQTAAAQAADGITSTRPLAAVLEQAEELLAQQEAAAHAAHLAAEQAAQAAMEAHIGGIKEPVNQVFETSTTGSGGGSGGSSGGSSTVPAGPFTVTYRDASGEVVSIQTVENGGLAAKPFLQPGPSGSWQLNGAAYDFSTPVTADLELVWVGN